MQLTYHSDAGSQYTTQAFQQVLEDHRVLGSIGTVGDAYDNAMAESFRNPARLTPEVDRSGAAWTIF